MTRTHEGGLGEGSRNRADGPLHILFGFAATGRGGSYVSSALLIEGLRARGHRVDVCLPCPGPHADLLTARGIHFTYFLSRGGDRTAERTGMRAMVGKWLRAVEYLQILPSAIAAARQARPDVVHANDGPSGLVWGVAAKAAGAPFVWHVRNSEGEGSRWADWLRMRLADRLILVSPAVAKRFVNLAPPPHAVIFNGVDSDTFTPATDKARAKRAAGLPEASIVAGFAGSLVARKRPEWAIAALQRARQQGIDLHLAIAGEDFDGGITAKRLRQIASDAGVEHALHMLGYQSDLPAFMQALDVLLLPSRREAFGRVIVEAMAAGVPTLATDAEGPRLIISDGHDGYLTPVDEQTTFAARLAALAADTEKLAEAGRAARSTVRARFDHGVTLDAVTDVYRTVYRASA